MPLHLVLCVPKGNTTLECAETVKFVPVAPSRTSQEALPVSGVLLDTSLPVAPRHARNVLSEPMLARLHPNAQIVRLDTLAQQPACQVAQLALLEHTQAPLQSRHVKRVSVAAVFSKAPRTHATPHPLQFARAKPDMLVCARPKRHRAPRVRNVLLDLQVPERVAVAQNALSVHTPPQPRAPRAQHVRRASTEQLQGLPHAKTVLLERSRTRLG